jgi:hypothetical protein
MVREKVRGSPITRMEDYDSKEHTRTARSMAKAPRLVVNMVNGSTSGNLRRASSGKVSTPREGPPLLIQRVLRRPPTNVRHLRQSQEVHCVGGAFAVKLPHQILCADMGFLFRLDQCDQNVTGICPLQSIHVTISHIRVGSVCVRD